METLENFFVNYGEIFKNILKEFYVNLEKLYVNFEEFSEKFRKLFKIFE